jgi:PhnB protein
VGAAGRSGGTTRGGRVEGPLGAEPAAAFGSKARSGRTRRAELQAPALFVRQRVAGLPRPDSEGDGTLPRRGSSGVGHSIATIPREEVWFRIDSPAEGRLQWRQKQVPEGYPNVTPYLCVDGATAAIEFYGKVFGATERMRMPAPEGKIRHSELQIGDSLVMLSDEFPEMGVRGPKSVGATSVTLSVYVEDVDALFDKAVEAGAKVVRPIEDQFYGDRSSVFEDPFGHRWSVATHIEDVPPDEMAKRAAAMGG